jgi:hypothetical protein
MDRREIHKLLLPVCRQFFQRLQQRRADIVLSKDRLEVAEEDGGSRGDVVRLMAQLVGAGDAFATASNSISG